MSTIEGPVSNQSGLLGVLVGRSGDIRARLDRLNAQAGTGRISEDYSGLGGQAAISLDLRPRLASIDAWRRNIDAAATRMNIARTAMDGIGQIAADLRARLADLNGLNPASIDAVAAEARQQLIRVGDLLNSQAGGVHVFAGEDGANPPVPNPDSITTSGFFTAIQAAVSSLSANGAPATLAATLAVAASNASGISPFSAYLSQPAAALVAPVAETGPEQRVRTGLLASANAVAVSQGSSSTGSHMRDLMRALATVGALSSTQADAPELPDLVADLRDSLNSAIEAMGVDAGAMGDTESDLTAVRGRLDDTETAVTAQISRVEDVDMAQTLSRLSQIESQLQISYRLISGSNNLSLVKFLGST